jgi:hypothetical protein
LQAFQGISAREGTSGFFVQNLDGPFHIDFLHDDGGYANVITPEAGRQVTWIALDRVAGDLMIWSEALGDDFQGFSNPIVWSSPYATTSTGVQRHKVAVLADETQRGGDRLVVNAGVGAYLLAPGKLELIRLADGVGWIVESEPGESFGRPLWVDDDEVWVSVTPKGSAHENGILRLLRSSLGAPTVSRGF